MKRSAALLLTLVIAAAIAAVSADYFFRHPFYEIGDAAANSLAVNRAKHFAEIYGPYSRWGFHHPGPALFYVQALGEWLFFDALGAVPAPYNAQALMCLLMASGFFVGALQIFIFWLPSRCRWWFFPAAVAAAALHFGNTPPGHPEILPTATVFQTTWSAHVVVLFFFCMLTAGASVAAGRAEDLPLLVIAGGSLVHTHVAQPLFVLPCVLLAYAGLLVRHGGNAQTHPAPGQPRGWRLTTRWITEPARRAPRAHLVAAVILAAFALPVAVDLTRGEQSNFLLILAHLRSYHGQHKPLWQSVLYFLQFGAYRSYRPDTASFEDYDPAGIRQYFRANALFYVMWMAVFGCALATLVRRVRTLVQRRPTDDLNRFLAWAGVYLLLAVVLTLRWGVMQDGEMYYYNAWFNFGIYFFAVVIAVAAATRLILTWIKRLGDGGSGLFERLVTVLAGVICVGWFAARLKYADPSWPDRLAMHDRVARVIADQRSTHLVKFLDFPQTTWPYMAAVAMTLERAREPFVVPARWGTMFGAEHTTGDAARQLAGTDFQKWSLLETAPPEPVSPADQQPVALMMGLSLAVVPRSVLDLNDGNEVRIDFHSGAPSPEFQIAGWTGRGSWGEWTEGKRSVLTFRAAPVNADVELTIDGFPYLDPPHGLTAQRLNVFFNGERVGPELKLDRPEGVPVVLTIPMDLWNRVTTHAGGTAVLELEFPSAISSQKLDPAKVGDPRVLAFGMRQISLRCLNPAQLASRGNYVFDGRPISPSEITGISADGWGGPQATILLPRCAGDETPFLRLTGHAPQAATIPYPYRVKVHVGMAMGTEVTIPSPGPFELLVPLPPGDERIAQLDFARTFVPARVDPNSRDERTLSLLFRSLVTTTSARPLLTSFRQAWYDEEVSGQTWWRWCGAQGVVVVAAQHGGSLVIRGEIGTQAPDNGVDLLLDGVPVASLPARQAGWTPCEAHFPLPAGQHLLTFRSRLPGVQPPGETRIIAFGLKDAVFKLE